MCGICGYSGPREENILREMSGRLRHRGPDEEGFFSDGRMNLCSRRLNIVDLADGKQPMCDPEGQVYLVWNGEVYNHRTLRRKLEQKGHRFRTDHSDTEVLLHMYLEYGEEFVHSCNGMFAIAIWDRRSGTLLLYRDRMGIKPLYYTLTENSARETEIIFASEIKALFAHTDCQRERNDEMIYQYFSYKNCLLPQTAWQGIYEIMPGQYLRYKDGLHTTHTYWDLGRYYATESVPFQETSVEQQLDEISEHLEDLLSDAVRIRLDADVTVGSFLSGGLDSSLIAALAGRDIPCFTLGHSALVQQDYDKAADVEHARILADSLGLHQEILSLTPRDVTDRLTDILSCFDEPFSGSLSTYMLSEFASKKVKTVLSGDGADELFGGYLPHMLSFPMEHYAGMENKPADGSALSGEDRRKLRPMEDELSYLASMYEFSRGDESLLSYRILLMTDEEKQLFLGDRLSPLAEKKATWQTVQRDRSMLCGRDSLNRNLEYDSRILLPNQVLKYTDRLSMAHSLEIRSPFMDHRILEYVAGISGHYKMYKGETKYLLKAIGRKYLPDSILNRKKEGFVMPINDWMQRELKEFVLDTLSLAALLDQDYLRPEGVYVLLQKYYSDPAANYGLAGILWNFVCFQTWITRSKT